ncbi:MAG: carbohydrate ABC transporter permease [Candidatus Rokuibacteriota bacterium]
MMAGRGTVAAVRTRLAARDVYPYLMVGPAVLLVALGVIYPLAYVAVLSLHEYSPFRAVGLRFVGIGNYLRLAGDPEFWASLRAGGIWVAGSVVPQFLLGLGMALLLNERFPGRGTVRTVLLLPWVVSGVVTGIIWTWLFDGTVGVVNDLLQRAALVSAPVAWTVGPVTTWLALFVANAWRGAPFFAIVLLAALQAIDPGLYEAAKIDGAGRWERFRWVTLPLILDAVIVATLLRALWTFNFLDLIWTMTRGGPANATRTMPLYVFDKAYIEGDFGYASTVACVLAVLLLGGSVLYWQLHRLAHDE